MHTPPPHSGPRQGFTLTEVMVAGAIAAILLTVFMSGFTQQRNTFHQKNIEQELQQNVRTAMMYLQRDLRYAASGMVMGPISLDQWFGLDASITDIPWITDGGTGPDQLTVVGISGQPVGTLSQLILEGSTSLVLDIDNDTVLPYIPVAGDVLVIAGIEAVVVNQVHNDTLSISRDPTTNGVGVHLIYPAGSEVYLLNTIQYSVADVEGTPSLLRADSRYTYSSDADKVVADGIEDFQLTRAGDVVSISLTGRSRKPVPGYTSPDGDNFPHFTLTSQNRIRNSSPRLSIQGWPSDILIADAYTPTPGPTAAPTPTPTVDPYATATPVPSPSPTPEPTATPTPGPTPTLGPTPEPTATPAPTPTIHIPPGQIKRPSA